MRRILLPVLVIGVLLLGACGAPSAPPAEPPPTTPPTEPEEPPDYTAWIALQLKDLNQAMIQFISNDSNYMIHTRVYDEEEGEVLVHEFGVPAGGSWWWTAPVPAFYFQEAKTHVNNAYWLTNESKLPDEVRERDVSTDEVAKEVSEALDLLKLQVESSYVWQEDSIEWIAETAGPVPNSPPEVQPDKEMAIQSLIGVYDDYREELSKMISKLELILSRLPSTTTTEG